MQRITIDPENDTLNTPDTEAGRVTVDFGGDDGIEWVQPDHPMHAEDQEPVAPVIPHATTPQVLEAILKNTTAVEWNEAVVRIREEYPDWTPDLTNTNFYECDLSNRDLADANFSGAQLDHASFRYCTLTDANFDQALMYAARFHYANVTGSNYKQAIHWDAAVWEGTTGYTPPLRDITEQVARHHLMEAIRDPKSEINEGLDLLRENGVRSVWQGGSLKFWLVSEIERHRSDCEEGECGCETEHACEGCCDCCACYRGECDCTPDHNYDDTYGTDEYYLATVIGKLVFEWSNHTGLYGVLRFDHGCLHPHISMDGTFCPGTAQMPQSLRAADYLLMLQGWIGQHNPNSEYREINDLPFVG